MAVVKIAVASRCDNTAAMRLAFQAVDTQIVGFGWVVTTDTGQLNLATVNYSIGQTVYGYKVYKLADTLQATVPFFMRIDYGLTTYGTTPPQYTFTVGTATDGAGNITTQASQALVLAPIAGTAVLQNCYFSGDTSRFHMCLFDGPTQNEALFFSIERSKDATGADNGDGMMIYGRCNGANTYNDPIGTFSQLVPAAATGLVYNALTSIPAAFNQAQNTMANGSTLGVALPIPFNLRPFNYGLGCLIYQGTDFGLYTVTGITVYSVSHSYIALNQSCSSPTLPSNKLTHLMMRYE